MPATNNENLSHEVVDDRLAMIYHYVMGLTNITHFNDDVGQPILKPSLQKIYPIFIVQYGLLAIFGIISNIFIIYYVMRYRLYYDVTQALSVNLALCNFIQCAIVMPITLFIILVQNWVLGQFMCFFLPLLQDIPSHVAMMSHLLIAWDRMRWLSDPLKIRLPSFVCSCATWLAGMVIALPHPIYITYLDLGNYVQGFNGVGMCIINLVDDMQEYMRGLFVIMYCGPTTILAYLYIRTSRELRPPEGPIGVMMFEHRSDARNHRQRTTSTTSSSRTINNSNSNNNNNNNNNNITRSNYSRSYDLYDAEVDVAREKRTQRHLGAMAATQVICICPLMILKIAKLLVSETYENTKHIDLTYLMFVWIAYLPTVIGPCIYASWMLSRPAKERLRGYFRLSSRRSDKKLAQQRSTDNSITQETTETCDDQQSSSQSRLTDIKTLSSLHNTNKNNILNEKQKPKINIISDNNNLKSNDKLSWSTKATKTGAPITTMRTASTPATGTKMTTAGKLSDFKKDTNAIKDLIHNHHHTSDKNTSSYDEILNNSCSNITSSTYCDGNDDYDTINLYHDKKILLNHRDDNKIMLYLGNVNGNDDGGSGVTIGNNDASNRIVQNFKQQNDLNNHRQNDDVSEISENMSSRRDSSSTFERDMEIIDLLERERSMDIQEMIERERIDGEHNKYRNNNNNNNNNSHSNSNSNSNISKHNLSIERRRKLPDINRIITTPQSPKKIIDSNFPNFVFTHNNININNNNINTNNIHDYVTKYDDNQNSRTHSSHASRKSSQSSKHSISSGIHSIGGGGGGGNNDSITHINNIDKRFMGSRENHVGRTRSISSTKSLSIKSNTKRSINYPENL